MRWSLSFKSRNGNHRNGHHRNGHNGNGHHVNGNNGNIDDLNGVTGDARPDFLCVGAQKAGTSWLYRQLESHPDFWMPPVKELHYFDELSRVSPVHSARARDEVGRDFLENVKCLSAQSHLDLEHYGRLFEAKRSLISGDITPAYSTLTDEIIERVVNHFPNMKVVFLARDPVERAWSQLSMGVRLGMINKFDAGNPEEVVRNLLIPGVLTRSHPSKIVARWRRYVRPDNFRLYFFDDLEENPAELRRSILGFLGGDPDKPSGRLKPHHNNDAGQKKLRFTAKVRDRMAQFFEHELKVCAAELGGRAKSWPARYGFSLLLYVWDLLDDSIDLFFWCDWLC